MENVDYQRNIFRFLQMSRIGRIISRGVSSSNLYTIRTHNCGELRLKEAGEKVTLTGWLQYKRMKKFMVVRDSYGSVQAYIPPTDTKLVETLRNLPYESVICVKGTVMDRGKDRNEEMKTGEIEIEVEKLEVMNECAKVLPLRPDMEAGERTRLKYRYLDIRSSRMQKALRLRSSFVHSMRKFLVEERGFVDVETPTLFRRTPGGASEFQVPSPKPHRGQCYSLPQSPQQFKQLLMVGGIDRYFQIARCYRDEGSKLDRQPEFTQVDLELSFTTQEDVMCLVEELVVNSWPDDLSSLCPTLPFPRITYDDAMRNYGIDKPDMRIPWKIKDCTKFLSPLRPSNTLSSDWNASLIVCKGMANYVTNGNKKEWKRLVELNEMAAPFAVFSANKPVWFKQIDSKEIIENFGIEENDCVVFSWGSIDSVRYSLGQMRNLVAEVGGLRKGKIMEFVWVIDFPLFIHEDGHLQSAHHPFTAPVQQDEKMLEEKEKLLQIKGQHYDLVMNGVELGGGSIRIHNGEMQEYVLREILGEEPKELSHLLEALRLGAPPHGGFALGLDRFVALLLGEGDTSVGVREVIAFPKSKEGRDLMSDAPCAPNEQQKEKYGFQFTTVDRPEDTHS